MSNEKELCEHFRAFRRFIRNRIGGFTKTGHKGNFESSRTPRQSPEDKVVFSSPRNQQYISSTRFPVSGRVEHPSSNR